MITTIRKTIINSSIKVTSILSIIVVLSLLNIACSNKGLTQSISPTYWTTWYSNPKNYATTDFKIAQNNTPFTIVVPSYLPGDIKTLPIYQGRAKSNFIDDEPVTISYYCKGSAMVIINEYNYTVDNFFADNSTYLMYGQVRVMEDPMTLISKNVTTIRGYFYEWNKNGANFRVTVSDQDKSEGRKVIESMINQ
jgi:hypothetical protein